MRKTVWAAPIAVAIASAFAAPAFAVTVDTALSANYVGIAGGYEISDSSRDADNGYGVQVHFGVPLSYTNGAIELNYWDVRRDRSLDGELDFQTALMINYVQDFGTLLNIVKPFATVGIGGVQEDVLGSKRTHAAVDLGFGTIIALPWRNLAIRTEAKAIGQDNDGKSAPGNEDFIADYRVMLGLQVPLLMAAASAAPAAEAPAAAEGCDLKVVDAASGRSDCASDSDKDGIADGTDQCPGTETGITVNEVGCPAVGGAAATPVPAATPSEAEAAVQQPEAQYLTFSTDGKEIDDESKAKLDAVASLMAADPALRVEIEGRTDNRGSEAYNIVLGAQRAEAVRQYLLAKGADAGRLTAISLGEFKPVASNSSDSGRKENRSVRFRLIK